MNYLFKGQKLEQFIGSQNGVMFDIVGSSAVLFIIMDEKHLSQYKLGCHYEFWATSFNETLFCAVKVGNNAWASAPYTPYLSNDFSLEPFAKGKGLPLTVALVSNRDGIVKDVDFLVLGNNFSNNLYMLCQNILRKKFDFQRYQLTIQAVYQKFATDDELVMQPGIRYSID